MCLALSYHCYPSPSGSSRSCMYIQQIRKFRIPPPLVRKKALMLKNSPSTPKRRDQDSPLLLQCHALIPSLPLRKYMRAMRCKKRQESESLGRCARDPFERASEKQKNRTHVSRCRLVRSDATLKLNKKRKGPGRGNITVHHHHHHRQLPQPKPSGGLVCAPPIHPKR
jgi:hypothetical protein